MTNKMNLADRICKYPLLSNYDVQTAGGNACISGCRRLRDLAVEYCKRKHAMSAYYYRDNYYYFSQGFRKFCRVWLNEQRERFDKKNGR